MKKSHQKIIGLLIVISLISVATTLPARAQNLTSAERACTAEKATFDEVIQENNKLNPENLGDYNSAFEDIQMAYHEYIGCMFEYAEGIILKSDGTDASSQMSANTPNASGLPGAGLFEWMSPDQACLDISEFKTVILESDPSQMLAPMLETHATYKDHLRTLGEKFDTTAKAIDENGKELLGIEAMIAKDAFSNTVARQRELEISSARLAIDLMFTSLKELRLSFVMHVHFQCTLKFLDKYRLALEEMRKVIDSYPVKLENASVSP